MSQETKNSESLSILRQRALEKLQQDTELDLRRPLGDTQKLLHELRTYQIELEMQNEDLRRTQAELAESLDRYSDLFDFAPVGFVTTSDKGLIQEVNFTLAHMLGVATTAMMGHPLSDFVDPDSQDILYQHFRRFPSVKKNQKCCLRFTRSGAPPLDVELDTAPSPRTGTGSYQLRTAVSDIADRVLANAERESLERQIQQAQKLESLGVMAGGIAHDFNNLLTAILGNASLALESLPAESPERSNLEEIFSTAESAGELVHQMLAFAGHAQISQEPIDTDSFILGIAKLLNVSISKKANLDLELGKDAPPFSGNPSQVRQVIMNLVINASESLGDKPGDITLSTGSAHFNGTRFDGDQECSRLFPDEKRPMGRYTFFEVNDSGAGMDSTIMDKVFAPFFSTKFAGRGLGLSAVLGIVRANGGAISLTSTPGDGTTFRVYFPALAFPDQKSEKKGAASTPGTAWRGSGRILLVDDQAAVLNAGRQMLGRLGFDILTATDGREALTVFEKHRDELVCVLLDLTMPNMDGSEAFLKMNELAPDVPVVVCSGYAENDIAQQFADTQPTAFLEKPFSLKDLTRILSGILAG